MSKIGTTDIKGIMLGSTEIVKAYLGSDVVYQNAVPAPEGYEWCEYIENTSSAYINTGCYADGTTKVEMVVENVTNSAYKGIIGTSRSGTPKTTILIDGATLKRNGTTYTSSGTWSGGALSNPICMFREYSGATGCALMKLYSLKITIGGVLLRDYVPIKRLEDNKYGLWDKVNQNFVSSASSSAFTGG